MSNRRSYSDEQRELISIGMSKGWPLAAIEGSPEFQAAAKKHDRFIQQERENFKAEHYLAHGNDGPFKDSRERERAFAHPLYHTSEEYRKAVAYKANQTSNEIMGINPPPEVLTPGALLRAAQMDSYNAIKQDLFDKASEKNPNKVEATQARQRLLELAHDPAYQEVMAAFEPPRRPLEEDLKANGPFIVQTFPQGTPEEMQAEADRRNAANYEARPGGRGDAGAEGPANVTFH